MYLDKDKYPSLLFGAKIMIPYISIAFALGFLVRFGQMPKGIGVWGNAILFPFVPIASQIIEFEPTSVVKYIELVVSLFFTILLIWIVVSPVFTMLKDMINGEK